MKPKKGTKENRKDHVLIMRVDDEVMAWLHQRVEQEDRTISDIIRRIVRDERRRREYNAA